MESHWRILCIKTAHCSTTKRNWEQQGQVSPTAAERSTFPSNHLVETVHMILFLMPVNQMFTAQPPTVLLLERSIHCFNG